MVFSQILYHFGCLQRGSAGFASDLAAASDKNVMEDRPHNRNPRTQLDIFSNYGGINQYYQAIL